MNIKCKLFKSHTWTSAPEEGIQPTQAQLSNGAVGFFEYAKLYCKDCGKVLDLSQNAIDENSQHE